ncbi:CAP domain-containing protein [Crocosphaera sp. XPORK-15E]|uniref:CAP domain-containing protein n=1 Tax=Crocosphaera sp. XPORK-15E TaxID=3110247 RepID=UPI002B1F2CBD|nr:CAP domain-containing protein [Crocosphaera sp. XPORK-15E]MEA5534308.1 CAP domain-containing protein [Crocosphaera sp. XPORK-15E]
MKYSLSRFFLTFPLLIISLIGCQPIEPISFEQTPRSQTPQPLPQSSLTDPSFLEGIEEITYREINQYRLAQNLPPLKLNSQITQQARIHSERMASGLIPVGHERLEERLKIINFSTPHQKGVENLAIQQDNSDPVKSTIKQWLSNPESRQNILGKYDETGIGVAKNTAGKYYFTQIFIQENPSSIKDSVPFTDPLEPWKNRDLVLEKSGQDSELLIALEAEINRRVNQYRLSKNLPPLQMNAEISYVARQHSQNMANKTATFSHDGFDGRAKTVGKTIPYQTFAENLAYIKGYPDLAAVAVKGWIDSPGHRKNMEGKFNLTGVGIAKNADGEYYFTQLFLLQR